MTGQYEPLVEVYDWLMPEGLLEPEGAAAAFAAVLDVLPPGARVLDCAAGTGHLAVDLALRAMRAVLRPGGILAVTSRNWALVRAAGSGLQLGDEVVVRHGAPGITAVSWMVPERWDAPHTVAVGVGLLEGTAVSPHVARLTFWPFTHEQLHDDLRACRFQVRTSSYEDSIDRYLVTAAAT